MRRRVLTLLAVALSLAAVTGCGSPGSTQAANRPASPAPAVKSDDRDNPVVKEAKADADDILTGLLAGKFDNDPDLAPVAMRVKGFQSWSIDSQRINPDLPKAVDFGGTLTGPQGQAAFTMLVVKQQNGKWMIGTFSGPKAK